MRDLLPLETNRFETDIGEYSFWIADPTEEQGVRLQWGLTAPLQWKAGSPGQCGHSRCPHPRGAVPQGLGVGTGCGACWQPLAWWVVNWGQGPSRDSSQEHKESTLEAGLERAYVQNHRMVGVGRDLCGSPSPPPCQSRVTYSRLHRTRQVLNTSRKGDSTTRLGSLSPSK